MKNVRGEILTLDLMELTNEKTGVVSEMTKIMYRIDTDGVEEKRHSGAGILECYRQGNYVEKLKAFTKIGKISQIDIELRPTKNGSKYVITKVDAVEL